MWGTRLYHKNATIPMRFIPTHVGNTEPMATMTDAAEVHPHACGEHKTAAGTVPINTGSSPRMWGTPGRNRLQPNGRRFIPTHVGNTAGDILTSDPFAVHPHACGEHPQVWCRHRLLSGSSPRMWGTLSIFIWSYPLGRFIPTHVGNT